MYTDASLQEQPRFFNVILSGGPPWGFTLAGGSEFGSKLYVKKVTDEKKAVEGTLYSGDEILSVNGAECTSRANAIQMVRSIEDELRLTICRWGNRPDGPSSRNGQHNKTQSHMYTNMVENMNDLSTSTYSLKRNSIQRKFMNENTVNGNYKILSINKSNESNEHNIRIGIDPQYSNENHFDGYDNSAEGFNIKAQSHSSTPQFNQRQKVTVRMVPVPQAGSKLITNTQSQHSSKLIYPDQTDYVEHESLQKVSTARAMFENMSNSQNKVQQTSVVKSPNTHRNATSPVLSQTVEKNRLSPANQTALPPAHAHSRSLPIEMAGKEFERAMQAYRKYREVDNGSSVGFERPKSAHYYNDSSENVDVPVVPTRYSQSELLKSFRLKGHQQSFDQPMGASHSTEDLRNYSDLPKSKTLPAGNKNDPANELRQAANRYHQELMKNYPKFIHSIAGKDNTGKFSRKISMPPDDAFSRGEPHRATIATTSISRMPRSYSAGNTLEMTGVQDFLDKSNDNSMMSRLLRDQNLVKIEEESKLSASKSGTVQANLRRCSTEPEKVLRTPDKSIQTPSSSSGIEEDRSGNVVLDIRTSGYHSNHQNTEGINSVSPQHENKMSTMNTEQWPHGTFIETDIDSEEAEQIIHRKDPSTDSAVYVMHENITNYDSSHNISDVNTLSKEGSDSMNELSQITDKITDDKATEKVDDVTEYDDSEYLPPPPDELLHDDHEEYTEKEKPQRTINRKKKDSYAVSSRNNSCVSTDSTTSTTTVDSGIVMRSEVSPRTSPVSSERYYTGSRERLDDDVAELNGGEPHATSTPERHEQSSYTLMHDDSLRSNDKPMSRSDSIDVASPRIEDLDGEKSKLMDSMREKICELREQEQEIADEIKMNEELGKKVLNMVEAKATQSEFSKYELFIGELNKIVALLLSLTQRLHRYELMLQDLDMSNEADKAKKDLLVSKIDKLKSQHEEACYLRDVNDKRGDNVATFLEKYCSEEEFADFQYYVDMKSQLALMQSEIREKVKLGEERLKALELTGSEWGFG